MSLQFFVTVTYIYYIIIFVYKKLYFVDSKFVGGILCGDISKASALLNALKSDTEMKDLVKKVF